MNKFNIPPISKEVLYPLMDSRMGFPVLYLLIGVFAIALVFVGLQLFTNIVFSLIGATCITVGTALGIKGWIIHKIESAYVEKRNVQNDE